MQQVPKPPAQTPFDFPPFWAHSAPETHVPLSPVDPMQIWFVNWTNVNRERTEKIKKT